MFVDSLASTMHVRYELACSWLVLAGASCMSRAAFALRSCMIVALATGVLLNGCNHAELNANFELVQRHFSIEYVHLLNIIRGVQSACGAIRLHVNHD